MQKEIIMNTLGTQLRSLRKENHLSQKKLAEASGVHENTIINFENDKRSPSAETLSMILGALGYELCIKRCDSL